MRDFLRLFQERLVLRQRVGNPDGGADVPVARGPAGEAFADHQRGDVALDDAAILEAVHVQPRDRRVGPDLLRGVQRRRRVLEPRRDPIDDEVVAAAGELLRGEAEHLEIVAVVAEDAAVETDDEDGVACGLEGRIEQCDGVFGLRTISHRAEISMTSSSRGRMSWPAPAHTSMRYRPSNTRRFAPARNA